MKIRTLWFRWLYIVILIVMLFGISMIIVPGNIWQVFSGLLYASTGEIESRFSAEANEYIMFAHGVLGTVLFGWGVAMLLVLRGPFVQCQPIGWTLLAVPIAAWYVSDTAYSLYTGFWQNSILNTILAVLFAIPLGATRKYFRREGI
jgi:hypothetical protein